MSALNGGALAAAIVVANLVVVLIAMVARRRRRRAATRPPAATGSAALPRLRVGAPGLQGSGKTLLLTSMYRRMQVPGDRGFFVRAPYQQLIELNRWYRQVADPGTDWPRGTSRGEIREFDFDVMTQVGESAQPVFRLGYLEYPGELLTDPDAPGSTAQQRLLESIAQADALIGVVDGLRIWQTYHGDARGRVLLQAALDSMIYSMLTARCPIVFVITKWDLLDDLHADENTRLHIVRTLLMEVDGFRDLVRHHSGNRVLRLIPVTAVGHEFAVLDHGAVRKRPDGRFRPGNVHAPLSAVVPDVLRQVELSVDRATREAIMAEATRKVRLGPLAALRVLSEYAATSAGRALVAAMGGGFIGDAALGLYLDSRVTPDQQSSRVAVLTEADQRAEALVWARRRVVRELEHHVSMLEATLPSSRLGLGESW